MQNILKAKQAKLDKQFRNEQPVKQRKDAGI
jgi:hypothetical protein